ncbi:olfactory receptor 52H1-like [Melanotaenia boesemani]|uniref:olfactory receptor 52H1-like n=1 Tax=Melanotaenia boesemani TaxID=1250792 RepID=UPI001C054427|nr:olfactory receptor 52H1-like [Melanotaenia boesemani]
MFENSSLQNLLTLETLGVPPNHIYPAFIFGTLTYLIIVFCNLLVLTTIAVSKKLHKPMFILLFNLPISDLVGATAFFPHLVFSIVTQNRIVSPPACIAQAFFIHFYGTGNLLVLTAMAYDRYIAICCPLKYNTIMSPYTLMRIIVLIWFLNFSMMFVLFMLLIRFKFCRTNIVDLYCNNPSLVKLICGDISGNNYYGIAGLIFLMGGPLLIIMYTYAQILRTCVITNHTDARKKAIQTCGTHLVVFLVLQINTTFTLISHRFQNASPFLRRAFGVSVLIFPPFLDPIIYGLKTRELRESIIVFLKRNIYN